MRPIHGPGVRRFAILALCLAGVAAATGCSTSEKPEWQVRRISRLSAKHYNDARQIYWNSCKHDTTGVARRQNMGEVTRKLVAAAQVDNDCPLFHSKLAEIRLEQGDLATAKRDFEYAMDLCEEWVPSWLGLADWAITTNRKTFDPQKLEEAEGYLTSAEEAIERLNERFEDKGSEKMSVPAFGMFGQTQEEEPEDGEMTAKEEIALVARWLVVNEGWRDDGPDWNTSAATSVLPMWRSLRHRLKARIWHQRARIDTARGEPADFILEGPLLESMKLDPDYIPTRIEQARLYRELRMWQQCESALRPIVQEVALYKNDQKAWFELATLYAEWYADERSDDRFAGAEWAFERLLDLNLNHVRGWLARGTHQYIAGKYMNRKDLLERAAECMDNVTAIQPGNPDAGELAEMIKTALAELEESE